MVNILGKFPPRGRQQAARVDDVSAARSGLPGRASTSRSRWSGAWTSPAKGSIPTRHRALQAAGPGALPPKGWRNSRRRRRRPGRLRVPPRRRRRGRRRRRSSSTRAASAAAPRPAAHAARQATSWSASTSARTRSRRRSTPTGARRCGAGWPRWVRDGGCLPDEVPELRRDLTAPSIGSRASTSKGTRRILESKKKMKKRGLPSPDDGDGSR
jgi:hypothetical protein